MFKVIKPLAIGICIAAGALVTTSHPALALDPYDAPTLSCESSALNQIKLKICGGVTTGAPAGVSIHYMKLEDFAANGYEWPSSDDPDFCAISLSGQPSLQHPDKSRWELLAGECETIIIGDINFDETGVSGNECSVQPLECGTDYVFRAFAHAGRRMGRSDWTENVICTTAPCPPSQCTFTQGYWKTHGPGLCLSGQNSDEWPVSSLTLGTVNYTAAQLCAIFNEQSKSGNGLVSLAHQLITAKFNLANGATSCIGLAGAIASADALIGNAVVPPVGSGFIASASTSALTLALDVYNNGGLCTPNCHGGARPARQRDDKKNTTWGTLKVIYK